MRKIGLLKIFALLVGLWAGMAVFPGTTLAVTGNIHSTYKWAWSETTGWINFAPSGGGVTVYSDHLIGSAWGENIGWIRLGVDARTSGTYANDSAADWGVNRNGNHLSGYAWSETTGWINFNPDHAPAAGTVTIDATGHFHGFAWGENIGWISFNGDNFEPPLPYQVATVKLINLAILGPAQLAPATAANYQAFATFDDGSSALVAPDAWIVNACSTVPCPAVVDSNGLLTVTGAAGDSFTLQGDFTFGGGTESGTLPITIVITAGAGHFGSIRTSPLATVFAGNVTLLGVPAQAGDEVGVYDSTYNLVGSAPVDARGVYGPLVVYGDDPTTPAQDEGAQPGERLTFLAWDSTNSRTVRLLSTPRPVAWAAGGYAQVDLAWGSPITIPLQAGWNLISFPLAVDWYLNTGSATDESLLPVPPEGSGQTVDHLAVADLAEVFSSIDGQYDQIVNRRGSYYYAFGSDDPANLLETGNDLTYIAGGYGYFIHVTDANGAVLTLNADSSLPPLDPGAILDLPGGSTMVGYWGQDVRAVSGAEAAAGAAYPAAGGYQPIPPLTTVAALDQAFHLNPLPVASPPDYWLQGWTGTDFQRFDPPYPAEFQTLKFLGPGRGYLMHLDSEASLYYGD